MRSGRPTNAGRCARDEYREQIALSEVVIVNKCDVAQRGRIDAVLIYARLLQPPKLALVETAMGKITAALLDAGAGRVHVGRTVERGS